MQENSPQFVNNILKRLKKALNVTTDAQLAKQFGVKANVLSNWKSRGTIDYNRLFTVCDAKGLSVDEIVYGRKMGIGLAQEPTENYAVDRKAIPLIEIEAVAGFGNENFSIDTQDVQDHYHIPDFYQVDFMIRVTGESMIPTYLAGDIVACRVIREPSFIQWNRVHLLATKTQGIIIKRLKKSDKKGYYSCVSDNPKHDPYDVPVNEIDSIALVVGSVRLE